MSEEVKSNITEKEEINEKPVNEEPDEEIVDKETIVKEPIKEVKDKLLMNSDFKKKADDIYMQSDIVDQLNYNQQSNVTLSSYSVVTQSFTTIKINIAHEKEGNWKVEEETDDK